MLTRKTLHKDSGLQSTNAHFQLLKLPTKPIEKHRKKLKRRLSTKEIFGLAMTQLFHIFCEMFSPLNNSCTRLHERSHSWVTNKCSLYAFDLKANSHVKHKRRKSFFQVIHASSFCFNSRAFSVLVYSFTQCVNSLSKRLTECNRLIVFDEEMRFQQCSFPIFLVFSFRIKVFLFIFLQ